MLHSWPMDRGIKVSLPFLEENFLLAGSFQVIAKAAYLGDVRTPVSCTDFERVPNAFTNDYIKTYNGSWLVGM